MTSINTNVAATVALRTLQETSKSLETTQKQISTGLKIGEAKDNAAYWAISTTLKSDNKSLATVKDALGVGAATVDTAYQGLNKAKEVLDEIKSKLTAATAAGVDRNTIQNEIKQLQDQLTSIAGSSIFSGENWLSVDTSASDYNATKSIVASFARSASGSVSIGTIGVDISNVALFDGSTVAGTGGIVDKAVSLKGSDGRNLTVGGSSMATSGNTATGGIANTTGTVTGVLNTAGTSTIDDGDAATASSTAAGNASSGQLDLGTVATAALTALNASDTLTFSFKLNGIDRQVSFAKSAIGANTATGLANALNAALTTAGLNTAVVAAAYGGSSTDLRFDLQGTTAGDTFQLTDIVAKDASGRAFNPTSGPILGAGASFVASTAGTYLSDTLVWTSVANKTAQVSFKVDGVDTTVEVATGANVAAFVANLNANSNFSTKAVASGTTTLTVTSATTGGSSKVDLNSIVFKNLDGTVFTPGTTTAFDNVGAAAKVTTVAFGPLALDADDNIKFDIAVNDATGVKTVTIDKALIDKTLGASANGRISVVADYKKVFDAALTAAGVSGLKTTVNAGALDIETTMTGGTDAKITITKAGASNGGAQISVDKIDISSTAMNGLTSDQVKQVLSAYIEVVNTAINKVTSAAANLGSVSKRIDLQQGFVDTLMDTIDKGVGNLIDADISEESTKLQALQVKQQLGVQALSIANQSSQNILRLFQ